MRGAPALLLLLLATCSKADTPADSACERQANDNPAVRELVLKGAGSPDFLAEHQESLALARRQATLACLRGRGLAPPGGVEAPRSSR